MGLEKFEVVFDNPYGVYYGGQTVSGKIIVVVNAPKKVRGITVKIKGRAEVKWQEQRQHTSSSGTDPNATETFSSDETYFENKVTVYGGGSDQTLHAGDHAFPFSYVLPNNIPSSFEGEHGFVRYTVNAVIDRPWKFDHEAKVAFTVICPVDLNADPKLLEPIHSSKEKTFGWLCCADGPLNVTVTTPLGGVVPGETLVTSIEVDNTSSVYIPQIKLFFVKYLVFRAQNHTKKDEVNICEKLVGYVDPNSKRMFADEKMSIPSLPPSNLSNCSIIDIDYVIKAVLKTSGMHRNVTIKLPITLGTIPFYQRFANITSSPSQPPLGWNLAPSAPQDGGSPSYPDLPPPTYEQSVEGAISLREPGENDHLFGAKSYAPRYPVYNHTPLQ